MSEENVEILRALYAKVGDGENPEALYELLEPDVVWDNSSSISPEAGVYRGHEGVRQFFRRWAGTWAEWHFGPEKMLPVGDRVLVYLRERVRSKGAGVELEHRGYMVWTLRDGKATAVQLFDTEEEALEALK